LRSPLYRFANPFERELNLYVEFLQKKMIKPEDVTVWKKLINGDYRGQNASVIKHNQSALGDKPAT
jgi:hypothetical protein